MELLHIPRPSSDLRFSSKNSVPPPCLNSEPVRFTACFFKSLWSPQPTHSSPRARLVPVPAPQSQALQHTHGRPSADILSAGPSFGFFFVWTVQHGLQDLSSSTKDGTLARCSRSVEGCPRAFQESLRTHCFISCEGEFGVLSSTLRCLMSSQPARPTELAGT